jgi:tetratricopeptide (TPR) repeat protein
MPPRLKQSVVLPVQSSSSPARWTQVLADKAFALVAGAAIAFAALAVYRNSFSGPFIFDDLPSIVDNPTIRHLGSGLSLHGSETTVGRPVFNLTFALNYALGGMNVWGYHAVNLLVHTLAGLVLFGLVRRTLQGPSLGKRFGADALPLALAVAVIWVVHPLQTEAVTYISQRAESLMGLFYLLTIYCFIRGTENRCQVPDARYQVSGTKDREQEFKNDPSANLRPLDSHLSTLSSRLFLLGSVLCCLLGALCKEIIVTAPVMVLLYDRAFVAGSFREAWRLRWRYYLGLAGVWLLLACLTSLKQQSVGFGQGVTWWSYALTSCRSVVLYLKLAFWPRPLVLDYGMDFVQHAIEVLPFAAVLAGLIAATAIALWRRPALGFVGAWLFGILAPASSVIPVAGEPMAEHRMYLSLAAVIISVVLGLYAWIGRRSLLLLATLAMGLGWLTVKRNEDYRSILTILGDTVAKCPDNARARFNFGTALANIPGRAPDAIAEYKAALRINPNYTDAHNNLGLALAGIPERMPEAIAEYEAALRIDPNFIEARCNLGNALAGIPGRLPEAVAEYKAALRINPDFIEAHCDLGSALAGIPGRLPEAMAEYKEALRIDPDNAEVHNNLGNVLAKTPGQSLEAIAEYEEAVRLNPAFAKAHFNLGNALAGLPERRLEAIAEYETALRIDPNYMEAHYALGSDLMKIPERWPEAVVQFQAVVQIKPDFAAAHNNLGAVLARIPGRTPEAIAEYETALRIDPDSAEAHHNLACALANIPGRMSEAIAQFQAAVRIKPDYAEAHNNLGAALSIVSGRSSEAVAEFETALRINPDYAEAHHNLGCALANTAGRMPDAIAQFQAAVRIKPDFARAHCDLGMALSGIPGRESEAMTELEMALRIDYNLEPARRRLDQLRAIQQ